MLLLILLGGAMMLGGLYLADSRLDANRRPWPGSLPPLLYGLGFAVFVIGAVLT